jgi:hypothetical protein
VTAVRRATASTLLTIAGLHALWGHGSTFPFPDRETLNDTVVGRRSTPPPLACFAVAGALTVAASLVADVLPLSRRLQRLGVTGVAAVLASRAAFGLVGRTDLVSPGSASSRFRRLDRRIYSPLCLALAAGALASRR